MRYFILFTLAIWPYIGQCNSNLEAIYSQYRTMVQADTVQQIESFYTINSNNELKWFFKKRCGIKCILGLSSTWKKDYDKYVLYNNGLKK